MRRSGSFQTIMAAVLVAVLWVGPIPVCAQSQAPVLSAQDLPFMASQPSSSMLKGVRVDSGDPFRFSFFIDTAAEDADQEALRSSAERQIKYFLAGLAVPSEDLWVNLSPYEKDRIIPDKLGLTELGRDMLAQDYILKKVSALLTHPDSEVGKVFWNNVYQIAADKAGAVKNAMDALTKVWILPQHARVMEKEGAAFVVDLRLTVQLDRDHGAMDVIDGEKSGEAATDATLVDVVRSALIPALEEAVNTSEDFLLVRQIYSALILAKWYKDRFGSGALGARYLGKNKVRGILGDDPEVKEKIYGRYVAAFQEGAYSVIREETDPQSAETVARKYFSGGLLADDKTLDRAMDIGPFNAASLPSAQTLRRVDVGLRPVRGSFDPAQKVERHTIKDMTSMAGFIRTVPAGTAIYIDIDDTLLLPNETFPYPSSRFVGDRYRMVEASIAHMAADNIDPEWVRRCALGDYEDLEKIALAEGLYRPLPGALELVRTALDRGLRVVLATNRHPGSLDLTVSIMHRLGFPDVNIIPCGYGRGVKAEAIVNDVEKTGGVSGVVFIDNDRGNVDDLAVLMDGEGIKTDLFYLELPEGAPARPVFEEAFRHVKEMAAPTSADDFGIWELALSNVLVALFRSPMDRDEKLDQLRQILEILEKNGLNHHDFVATTKVYQYCYDLLEGLMDVPAFLSQMEADPKIVPLELELFFRIVMPENFRTAIRFYQEGRFSVGRPIFNHNGAQAEISIDQDSLFLFLEPILNYFRQEPPDHMILMDTGSRPYAEALGTFFEKTGLPTALHFLPVSFHDTGDQEEDIYARLLLGKVFEENGGDLEGVQALLRENNWFPDLQADAARLKEVAAYYAGFFPMTSDQRVVLFDDNVASGKTIERVIKILERLGMPREKIKVTTPLLLRRKGAGLVDIYGAFISGHVSWDRFPPKIAIYPSWENNFMIRGVGKRGPKDHLVRLAPNQASRHFNEQARKRMEEDLGGLDMRALDYDIDHRSVASGDPSSGQDLLPSDLGGLVPVIYAISPGFAGGASAGQGS